ncbi:MAG: PsiF family protein [Caldimonas sp.]
MKQFLTLSAALALALSTSAFAASHKMAPEMSASAPMTKQQSKMGDCNKSAADKKGDERKAFMKSCLSGDTAMAAPAKPMTQQDKMKKCSGENKGKKGDEYKSSMKACLSA